jgi:hypothetical protein
MAVVDEVKAAVMGGWEPTFYPSRDGGVLVATAFIHGDGDGYAVFVDQDEAGWFISDLGMQISQLGNDFSFTWDDECTALLRAMVATFGCEVSSDYFVIRMDLDGPPDPYDVAEFLMALAATETIPAIRKAALQAPV